jgi:hypothetical protein
MILSREQHCALADLSVRAYMSRRRRFQLPEIPSHLKAPPGKGFTPLETLALATANQLVEQFAMAPERAAGICSRMDEAVLQKWDAIAETSKHPGTERDILFGRALVRDVSGQPGHVPVCGTLVEISRAYPAPLWLITISLSQIGGWLRARAYTRKLGIDMDEFWRQPAAVDRPPEVREKTWEATWADFGRTPDTHRRSRKRKGETS